MRAVAQALQCLCRRGRGQGRESVRQSSGRRIGGRKKAAPAARCSDGHGAATIHRRPRGGTTLAPSAAARNKKPSSAAGRGSGAAKRRETNPSVTTGKGKGVAVAVAVAAAVEISAAG